MKPVLFWPTCRSPESALSRIYPGSVNLFPEQSLEEWFRKNRRCSIAICGNGEKVKEITARGLPVNANNVAPPPLNGARKSIEELVNQVGVRFEEMLARAWYRWLKGTINQSVVAYKLSSNLITDPSLPRSNSLLSQNRSPPLSPRKLPPRFPPISDIDCCLTDLSLLGWPIVSATGAGAIDQKLALDPRPSPLPPPRFLSRRQRERGSTARPEIGEMEATSGRRGSRQNPSYLSCVPIVTQSKSGLGIGKVPEELVWSFLPRLIKGSEGVQRESPSSSTRFRRGRRARRKFTRPISITIEGTEHYRF